MKTLVSVCVTHHLNINDEYLKHALAGLSAQKTEFAFEVIVITSAESVNVDVLSYSRDGAQFKIVHDTKLNNATVKFKHFMRIKSPDSKFILMHSDDVVMAGPTLQNFVLAQASLTTLIIQNPLCNGDVPNKYITPVFINLNNSPCVIPQHLDHDWLTSDKMAALAAWRPSMMLLCPFDWLAFYCTFMPIEVLEKVGELDERLDCKNNDVDFCFRAGALNIASMVNFGALAIHFGSKTLQYTKSKEDEAKADAVFTEKLREANII
jgi:hypothetical protein